MASFRAVFGIIKKHIVPFVYGTPNKQQNQQQSNYFYLLIYQLIKTYRNDFLTLKPTLNKNLNAIFTVAKQISSIFSFF